YTLSGGSQGVAERYTVFPAVCLAWAVITSTAYLVVASHQVMPSARPVIAAVVASLVLFGWVSGWRPSPIRTSGATWSDSLERGERQCTHRAAGSEISLPIAPAGWFVHLHCSAVRDASVDRRTDTDACRASIACNSLAAPCLMA